MHGINIDNIKYKLNVLESKKTIALATNNEKMLNDVFTDKALVLAEICNIDQIIRERINSLLQ